MIADLDRLTEQYQESPPNEPQEQDSSSKEIKVNSCGKNVYKISIITIVRIYFKDESLDTGVGRDYEVVITNKITHI